MEDGKYPDIVANLSEPKLCDISQIILPFVFQVPYCCYFVAVTLYSWLCDDKDV